MTQEYKPDNGYVKELFLAVEAVCKLLESEIKNALLKEITAVIAHCNKPLIMMTE